MNHPFASTRGIVLGCGRPMRTYARVRLLTLCLALATTCALAQESTFYRTGKAAFRDELYDVAEKQFRQLVERHPESKFREESALLWAQCLLRLGRPEEAVKALRTEIESKQPPKRLADGYVFWLAEALSKDKQFAEAGKSYRELLEKHPRSIHVPQAKYGLAWALVRTQQFKPALELFGELAASRDRAQQPLAMTARLDMGQVYLEQQEFDAAISIFRPIAEKVPPDSFSPVARYWLGMTSYAQKRYDEALAYLQPVTTWTKLTPSWVIGEAWFSIGWTYWHKEEYEKSALAFDEAFKLLGDEKKKRESAIQYGQCYLRLGQIETSLERMREFIRKNPKDSLAPVMQLAIADILFSQKRWEEAAREYSRFLTDHPEHSSQGAGFYGWGWCLFEQRNYEGAIQAFQKAAATASDAAVAAEAHYKIGDAYYALRQFDKSSEAYQTLIGKFPQSSLTERAVFQVIQAQLNLGNISAAQATLQKLVEQFPASQFRDDAYLQIALAYVNQGFYTAAREVYQSFLTRHSDSPLVGKAMLDLGQSYYLEGAYPEAIEQFNKVALANPPLPGDLVPLAKYYRARCLYQMNESAQAVKEFTELIEKHKGASVTPEVQFRIGEFFYNQRNYPEAQRQFDLLHQNFPQSPFADVALYWAGRAAYSRHGYNDATAFFEKLLKNYPQSRWRPDARFWQGDAMIEQGGDQGYANALLVFDQLIRDHRDSDLVVDAWGRKGDCQFTLKRYQEAITSYQNVLDHPASNIAQRNHASYQIGLCYEKLDRVNEAFEQFMKILYDRVATVDSQQPVESMWFCKAGFAAAAIKKQSDQWREAMKIYQRIVEANVSCSQEAQDQVRMIAETKLVPLQGAAN